MLTGVHGNMVNYSTLAKSLGISMPTVKRYMHYFEAAYFIRFLLPWHTNVRKRLVKTPKLYFRDSGVLHYLADISNLNQLFGNQLLGASWEGYVLQQILANLPERTLPFFYRTKDGSELDLVLVKGRQPYLSLEIKFSDNPSLSRGNRLAIEDVGAPMNIIVTPTGGDFPLEENIRVCGLEQLWPYLEQTG